LFAASNRTESQDDGAVKGAMQHAASSTLGGLMRRRVVVTGVGAITPLGGSFLESWEALLRGESGATALETALQYQEAPDSEFELAAQLSCQVACPVRCLSSYNAAKTARFVQMSLVAAQEAIAQASLQTLPDDVNANRFGVCMGSGMSSVREIMHASNKIILEGVRKLSPHFVPKVLSNSAAGRLSIEYGLQGPNQSISTACAAGSHAIGEAFRYVQYGMAEAMLAGGAEACIDPLSMAGFSRIRALSSSFNDSPAKASRPFDVQRDGFVMGEGAVVLVLEELQHAQRREAPILAEVVGYGLTGDAFHITAPDPDGKGAQRAMELAIQDAGVNPSRVGYVNAHATSTPKGDEIEARAIKRVLAEDGSIIRVSSTKGATGHLLGAAGAIEAAFCIQALVKRTVPATLNLEATDESSVGLEYVRSTQRVDDLEFVMSNSFGFGGTNACLVLKRWM
jgi:3-oxoacyl-[acyl-carrier-protein] synthase II